MKKYVLLLLAVLVLLTAAAVSAQDDAGAGQFDWESYSYEELLVIQSELNDAVEIKRREWAIENGNRTIELDIPDATIYTTATQQLTPTVTRVLDDAPENTTFVWTSSDDTIARVSASGTVTGVSAGDAVITCTAADDEFIFATADVHVVLPVTAVKLDETAHTLLLSDNAADGEFTFSPIIEPADAFCQDVTWTSSNEAVATVDENGTVTAVAPGTAVITVLSDDAFSASYPKRAAVNITVKQAVSAIELDQTDILMNKNAYLTLKSTVLPETATTKTLTWESSDPSIVRVQNGALTALACGDVVITATATDGSGVSAQAKVTVIQMVTLVQIPSVVGTQNLAIGDRMKLEASIQPADATDKTIEWSSSDESVITVSENGTVKAVGVGSAVVTASAADGSGKTAAANFYVPTIGFTSTSVTITSREGQTIDIPFYGDSKAFEVYPTTTGTYTLTTSWDESAHVMHLKVTPISAGTVTVFLKDNNDPKSNRSFSMTVAHSAAYDTSSFPRAKYDDALRNPDRYDGTQISIYGKVVQKLEDGGTGMLRVGTSWGWDDVFYVNYNVKDLNTNVIEDDWITVYGTSTGTVTYSSIWGQDITIPSMDAERIFIGNH